MIREAITKNGAVRGLAADDPRITVFRGIPFAAPPVGENRWKAPKPCENWEGIRNCYEFGPISMQDQPGVSGDIYCREFHVDPDIPASEDSLYLNVWTGAKSTDDKLPVLVFIYGGAFQWGYTAEMEFNGERLARHGIVVVTIAYRLGVFGFLAHPDLPREDALHPANFGLLDQLAGLRWVHDNIAAFGGDSGKITLAGQSAGGMSVAYALANPDAAKMIDKAAILSGLIRNPFFSDAIISPVTYEEAQKNGKTFLEYIGCASIEEARSVDSITLRDKYKEYASSHPRFVPCIDGVYAKEDPYKLMLEAKLPDVPFLTGYTRDEFLDVLPISADPNDDRIKADIITRNGQRLINTVQNSVRNVANTHVRSTLDAPMYVYMFGPDIPGPDKPGAFHSCDLWFFFETIQKCWRPYNGLHYELARRMCDYFSNFIKTGDPNGTGYDGKALPEWKKISSKDPSDDEMDFT